MEINDIALPVGISLKNRYQLRETYYIGPMSIVYMGYDMQTGKQVVIKEFCPYKLSNRDMDEKSIVCRSNTCIGSCTFSGGVLVSGTSRVCSSS